MAITLQKLKASDWLLFAKWWQDKELVSMTSGNFLTMTDEKIKDQINKMIKDRNSYHWLIEVEDRAVGQGQFS